MTRDQFNQRLQFIKSYSGSDAGRAAEDELFADINAEVARRVADAMMVRNDARDAEIERLWAALERRGVSRSVPE